jgi:hypothetical protein
MQLRHFIMIPNYDMKKLIAFKIFIALFGMAAQAEQTCSVHVENKSVCSDGEMRITIEESVSQRTRNSKPGGIIIQNTDPVYLCILGSCSLVQISDGSLLLLAF